LRRLLRIREIEEEQGELALEAGLAELGRLRQALAGAVAKDRRGRRLVEASARSGELRDRLAGLEEMEAARRLAEVLRPRLAQREEEVERLRREFLEQRVERRQAGTLMDEAEAEELVQVERRRQQWLDDWFASRRHRTRPRRVE